MKEVHPLLSALLAEFHALYSPLSVGVDLHGCHGDSVELVCEAGQVINVRSDFYGGHKARAETSCRYRYVYITMCILLCIVCYCIVYYCTAYYYLLYYMMWPFVINRLFAHSVICKHTVEHDPECPYCDQVSLNDTKL